MIIRHAEKPAGSIAFGVDENGSLDRHSLTVRGWQRAGALVTFFGSPVRRGIQRPGTIVASMRDQEATAVDDAAGRRAQQTVAPLRARIGGIYWNDIAVGNEDLVVQRLKSHAGIVLVAWTHKRIHNIVAGFVDSLAPEWDGARFDAVWILERASDGTYRLQMLNQDLLAGDLPA
jgi:hypothetical protein